MLEILRKKSTHRRENVEIAHAGAESLKPDEAP